MLRIGILQLGYETNTFSAGKAGLAQMGTGDWIPAEQVEKTFSGTRSAVSGALAAIKAMGAQPVPLDLISRGGAFNAGPALEAGCLESAMDRICGQLSGLQLDGLFYAMHGATCQEDRFDGDAYCLQRLRQVLGDKPIMCSMDLHGNITPQMCSLCDGIFGIKELPHTDFYEAGERAARVLIRTLRGELKPRMALVQLPMLLGSAAGNTISGAGKAVRDRLLETVGRYDLLDATFFHGFSAMDAPITGCSVVTVADGREPVAEAKELAAFAWELRRAFDIPVYDGPGAVEKAKSLVKNGYVVINESADNPGAGCPGDGTHLLRAMADARLEGSIMGPFYDPEAAAICHTHRPGDVFSLRLGGKTDPVFGEPLQVEAELLSLCDGSFVCATPMYYGAAMTYGPTARIRFGGVECIVVSRRFQTYDDRPFRMTGARMEDYRYVALKSTNHFRAYFTPICDAIVTADTPSIAPADIRTLPYRHITRPIYPLDPDAVYNYK